MANIGKNILDNLTTGMYSDSLVTFREYVQNACDQIDKAIEAGILDKEEELIDIYIDEKNRFISIEDNATGVSIENFISDLGDIANSGKEIGKNKGFRGIGRLCGLAYCRELRFVTSFKGENKASTMICDAKKMRKMLVEKQKYSVDEVWDEIVTYSTADEDVDKHYFRVEMIDINQANTDLLDDKKVRKYLSFVAPVAYKQPFILKNKIYKHAQDINYRIDEYTIEVNGSQIFKEYSTRLKEPSGNSQKNYDEISDVEFKEFYDNEGRMIAWMWYGLSRFEKQIPPINAMRGIRLRSQNIQIGSDNTLQPLFKENRGIYYFIGEVFAVHPELIPNSQRDYFNENEIRVEFEDSLRVYFYDVLHKIYNDANKIKNAYKRQEEVIAKTKEYAKKVRENGFVDEAEKQRAQIEVEKAQKAAEDARKQLDKYESNAMENSPLATVTRNISDKFKSEELKRKAEKTKVPEMSETEKKKSYITDSMSKLSRNERKLVSKILSIITDNAPKDLATQIIEKIKDELK